MTVRIGENLVVSGSLSASFYQNLTRDKLQQELVYIPEGFDQFRVHDAYTSFLPSTAAADDLGLVGGTFGTDIPSLQTGDLAAAGATTMFARKLIRLPAEYQDGQSVVIRIRAGMLTTVADTTATVDVEAYRSGGDTLVDGGDLVTTNAQSINSLTHDDYEFLVNSAGLVLGDLIDVRIAVAVNDGASGTAVIGSITNVFLGATTKG